MHPSAHRGLLAGLVALVIAVSGAVAISAGAGESASPAPAPATAAAPVVVNAQLDDGDVGGRGFADGRRFRDRGR
ncbi:MAG: hypothetical protein ACJ762_19560 [Solirubrobacteraceae bacterium]